MHFVGIDLAWGERNGTGLCVLGPGGLVVSGRRRSLEDVAAFVEPYTAGDCVVGIDAPLVVANPTGRRHCEQLVSRCFARHHAGTHSSNLGLGVFAGGGRAIALARRLSLGLDPVVEPGSPCRRAIEVFPHSALVALFGLEVTLSYKARSGRDVASRKAAFATAVSLVESLAGFEPPLEVAEAPAWRRLVAELDRAGTGAALDRAEDELDAYLCAYVAKYYWTRGTDGCRVVGDAASGAIVTPVSPDQAACLDALARGEGPPSGRRGAGRGRGPLPG